MMSILWRNRNFSKNESNEAKSAKTQVPESEHVAETKVQETEPAAAGASASEAAGASAPSLEIHEQQQETADEQFPPSPTRPSTPTLEAGLFTPAVSPVQITQETEETPRNLLLSLPPIPGSESGPSPYGYGYGTPVGAPEPQARRVLQFGEAGAARDPKDEEISRLQQELKRSERAISLCSNRMHL